MQEARRYEIKGQILPDAGPYHHQSIFTSNGSLTCSQENCPAERTCIDPPSTASLSGELTKAISLPFVQFLGESLDITCRFERGTSGTY